MRFSFAIALIVALGASVISGAPLTPEAPGPKTDASSDLIFGVLLKLLGNSKGASATTVNPTSAFDGFPLSNGFPTPSPQAVATIEMQAGGTLSDAPPPPFPGDDGITNLKLIAFNELFEVAYFSSLLYNVTHNLTNYEVPDYGYVVEALTAILAQEELHVLNANNALAHFNVTPIQPCSYTFPVNSFISAIALAGTFTDVVMGTLQDVQQIFAENNDAGLVRAIGSVIGQEGEQEGFYRLLQGKLPSSAAFLTTSTRDFAFTALQSFVVPGSCPNENEIDLKIFGALNVDNAADLTARNGTACFSVASSEGLDSNASVVYISGQNLPVTVPITNLNTADGVTTFDASFPFQGGVGGVGAFNMGLTIAAVVAGSPMFASADAVANSTLFGPGLIEID